MNPLVSQLFGTCRERNLRTLDVNVPDENHSFLVTSYIPELGTDVWPSYEGDVHMSPLTGWRGCSYTFIPTRAVYSGGLQSSRFGYKYNMGVDNALSTGELYLRAIVGIPSAPLSSGLWWGYASCPIITMIDTNSSEVKLALSWGWNGDTNSSTKDSRRTLSLVFTDRDGVQHSVSAEYVVPVGDTYKTIDIKVFIPANGKARIVAAPVNSNVAPIVDVSASSGRGYYASPQQTLAVNSFDGITPTNCQTRFMRIGIGNRISTALP